MPTIPQIKCGLFQFNITDYHAILGVPLGTSPEEVRQKYLKITRILFPDVRKLETQEEEQLADKLLSKLVNPSYETLVKDQAARRDYLLVLDQISDRASKLGESILKSKAAKELLKGGATKIDLNYRKYLSAMAKKEYQDINKVLERIALISEFNLVYLMLNSNQLGTEITSSETAKTTSPPKIENQEATEETTEEQPEEETKTSLIDPYLRRGQSFINKKDYQKAVMELREALKIDSKNAQAHTLLGLAYVKQNQLGMAKVHINKALQIDPENEMALEGKQVLQRLSGDSKGTDSGGKNDSKEQSNKRGGLLGGLFGKKKKK